MPKPTSHNATKPPSRGRRPSSKAVDARDHILNTATRLFSEQGIAATTVAQIAKAAGVTSAMVHYYFTNRETLLDIIVDERLARAINYIWEPATDPAYEDPFLLVEQFVNRMMAMTEQMPWLPSLWIREVFNQGGLLRERLIPRLPLEPLKRFAQRVATGQQTGSINDQIAPSLLYHSILALVMMPQASARVLQQNVGFPGLDRDALCRHAMALLHGGMRPPTVRSRRPADLKDSQ